MPSATGLNMAHDRDVYVHLETLRGLAALLVLFGHLRSYLWQSYPQVDNPGIATDAFYFLTGLGMPAVMIFFALSGFLISRSIDTSLQQGRWNTWAYASARLARLWTVLIPALLLTAFWDQLGQLLSDGGFYRSEFYGVYNSGPRPGEWQVAGDFSTFLQNAFFLQTITSPTFGSNIPLWSLAQEFWYYLLFPLIYLAAGRLPHNSRGLRALAVVALAAAMAWLPNLLLWGGVIWLCGVAAGHLLRHAQAWPRLTGMPGLIAGLALVLGSMVCQELSLINHRLGDFIIGTGCILLLPALARQQPSDWRQRWPRYARIAQALSEVSYTLYLAHFPLLGFIATVVLDNRRFTFPDPIGLLWFAGLAAVTLAYSFLLYALFERHTPSIRRRLFRLIRKPPIET